MSSVQPPIGPRVLLGGLLVLVGMGVTAAWLARRGGTERPGPGATPVGQSDPRRTYGGPYRNIDPAVRYVGDARCVECHPKIARSYALHPMGRSLVRAAGAIDRPRSAATNNPFAALGRRFEVSVRGKQTWHRQAVLDETGKPVLELAQEVRWVIGSGKKGHSYLTERDGYLLQTAISWFAQKQRWDLSPGFGPTALAGRVVPASCLYCHSNRLHEHPEQPDRFVAPFFDGHAIGCERCHGPGELHVKGDLDHTIVNPTRLTARLRDAVCEQCHLEGEARVGRSGRGLFDYRPGLELHDFWAVLVRGRQSGEDAKAVNHVEQMYQSKCFRRPVGKLKLGCTTCHDPHVAVGPQEREAHYRGACLKCHDEASEQRGCSEPPRQRLRASPADSCIACHMPRYTSSDIAHTASTDHRIVRRPDRRPGSLVDLDRAALVNFYQDRFAGGDPQAERNLGMGLVKMMTSGMIEPSRHGERALVMLESALAEHPQDLDLRASKVLLLELLERPSEVLAEAGSILARRPGDWRLLAQAGRAARSAGQTDRALGYWRRAVEINPFVADGQVGLIGLLIRAGKLDEARERCRRLLRLDPFNVSGRQAWVGFLLREGKKKEARAEFGLIRRLNPPDLAEREKWFEQQAR